MTKYVTFIARIFFVEWVKIKPFYFLNFKAMIQNEFVAYRRISKYYQAMKQSFELQNKQKK